MGANLINQVREWMPAISLKASNGSLAQTSLIEFFGVHFPLLGKRP